MCAPVAIPLSPENDSFTVSRLPLSVTVAKPLAVDALGGVSCGPVIVAVKVRVSAAQKVEVAPAESASSSAERKMGFQVMCLLLGKISQANAGGLQRNVPAGRGG